MGKVPVKVGSTILLLNADYGPLHLMSWKRAIILIIKDKAHVVSDRTIRLKTYVKIPANKAKVGKPTRSLILKRDRHVCQYCGYFGDKITVDHVIPKSRGGDDSWQNLVASCLPCNNCKGSRTPEEWALLLRQVFLEKTANLSPLPLSWSSYQIGMLKERVLTRGTTLVSKPKAPLSKISVKIATSEVEEWSDYLFVLV